MINKLFVLGFLVALLSGCNDEDTPPITLESFKQEVINTAGKQSINCGNVEANASPLAVNTCISDSFILNQSFYSFYNEQGIDSTLAYAVTMNEGGVVMFWSYDSFDGGKISAKVCKDPTTTSVLTNSHTEVFNCAPDT